MENFSDTNSLFLIFLLSFMDMSFSTRKGFIAVALLAATAPGTNALVTGASAGHQQLRSLKPRLSSSAAVPRLSSAGGGRGG